MRAWCCPRCPTPTTPTRSFPPPCFAPDDISVLRFDVLVRRSAQRLLRTSLHAVVHAPAELAQVLHLGGAVGLREQLLERVLPEDVRAEEEPVGLFQLRDRPRGHAAALAADL